MAERVCVIVNPAAGRGRGERALPAIRAAFGAHGITDVRVSASKADERTIADRAVAEGVTTIVACGGDGTWGNVANAILHAGAGHACRLGLIAAGTGNDFAKTVGAPAGDIAATARLVAEQCEFTVDVGKIEDYYFLNIAGFGFDIAVLDDIGNIKWLKGNPVYIYSALRQLFRYGGIDIDVRGAAATGPKRHLMLIVANARNFGGSFRIAPQASLADGLLDAVSIYDAPPLERVKLFAAATRGTHGASPGVRIEQAPGFTLGFASPPAYETDGEYRRARTSEIAISCVPRALRVIAPAT
jgi:diacylglycerol kinase (ATP)